MPYAPPVTRSFTPLSLSLSPPQTPTVTLICRLFLLPPLHDALSLSSRFRNPRHSHFGAAPSDSNYFRSFLLFLSCPSSQPLQCVYFSLFPDLLFFYPFHTSWKIDDFFSWLCPSVWLARKWRKKNGLSCYAFSFWSLQVHFLKTRCRNLLSLGLFVHQQQQNDEAAIWQILKSIYFSRWLLTL